MGTGYGTQAMMMMAAAMVAVVMALCWWVHPVCIFGERQMAYKQDQSQPSLRCSSYVPERWVLKQKAKKLKKLLTMETLLGTPGMMKPLANYIKATNYLYT
jgi:hypothetical protein